ncbi:MAG: NAD(P)H-quinone oxidoreductase [Caulobacteraceae bacterium]
MSDTPHAITAIVVEGGKGPPEALKPQTIPTPRPAPGQILVRVAAAGVNRPDLLQRRGAYAPPPGAPDTLGLEIAGEVAALGADVSRWRPGDRVCALLGGGGYAEYAVVDARHVLPIPGHLDLVQAAGLPETVFTVFANVFERGLLKPGETLLVHGATSGIGVTAIAMAKAAGARVISTSRGPAKTARALELGADISIDSTAEDFAEVVKREGGADVVLDMVGGDFTQRNLDVLKLEGRLSQIAFQAGSKLALDLSPMLVKRLTFTASTLRPRSADEKARLTREIEAKVWPWIASGQVRVPVDRVFPLRDAAAAHAYLEGGEQVGKVILKV